MGWRSRSWTPRRSPPTSRPRPDAVAALSAYERERLPIVNRIVLINRATPPDVLIEDVERRTDGGTFARIEHVISIEEIEEYTKGYQVVPGYDPETVARKVSGG